MSSVVATHGAIPRPASGGLRRRAALTSVATAAIGAAILLPTGAGRDVAIDPDLLRLLRFMALMKGGFAIVAFGLAWWRLARPAGSWRGLVYMAAPGLMAGGALALAEAQAAGLEAIALHAGLFAFVAAALTDAGFIPASVRYRDRLTPRG